jgi:hypothetical protein
MLSACSCEEQEQASATSLTAFIKRRSLSHLGRFFIAELAVELRTKP